MLMALISGHASASLWATRGGARAHQRVRGLHSEFLRKGGQLVQVQLHQDAGVLPHLGPDAGHCVCARSHPIGAGRARRCLRALVLMVGRHIPR